MEQQQASLGWERRTWPIDTWQPNSFQHCMWCFSL